MKRPTNLTRLLAAPAALALFGLLWAAVGTAGAEPESAVAPIQLAANPCNPCGANPCAANPCAKANPCAAANPCVASNPCGANARSASNPCGANPCAANPCGAGGGVQAKRFQQPADVKLAAPSARLIARGEELWKDPSIGKSGLACATCHVDRYAQMNPSFAGPYPHAVAMPKQMSGVAEVNAAEMVNFCMLTPMASEPLAWDSEELAALAAWVEHIRPGYVPGASATSANPCGATNPCGSNPCGATNPRGANPCAANPCGANPCSGRSVANPCAAGNPCGG
jgi:hypothetical protein